MADNKAEMLVKASSDWSDYIKSMVDARGKALKLKLQMTYIQMLERQEDRSNWLARSERTMGRSGP
jgi:hypothetical protein